MERHNPNEIVVGDIIILQVGDMIPADCVIIDGSTLLSNESSLTGEAEDVKKSKEDDCFLLSSCLITEGSETRGFVIGVGLKSQWGKIKANLSTESINTPLQDKLEEMTALIGYIGIAAAFATFVALIINIFVRGHGKNVATGFIDAFIMAVTIIVVAIPEGLPLAVTISLAYSTKKMYSDQCFIRVLSACETMGNATNICSDKTGTLTENRMTIVSGIFGDVYVDRETFQHSSSIIPENVKRVIVEHVCVNRTAYLVRPNEDGSGITGEGGGGSEWGEAWGGKGSLSLNMDLKPQVIGNKTEGALIEMVASWGYDYEDVKASIFNESQDKIFAFNSVVKRSTAIIHRPDGSVRLFCKGASEVLLKCCTM